MSFLSVLKTIGKDAMIVEGIAAPFVTMLNPAAGAVLNGIAGLVIKAEQVHSAEKQGATKKQMVIDEFTALFPMFQAFLKDQAGLELTFNLDALGAMIDATVAQLNAAKSLHDTFKLQKI